jgi:NADH dehydrogenase FAD-containing subunit
MKLPFHVRSIVRISLLCALLGTLTSVEGSLCRAESARHMAKRVHKVEKKLVEYRPGTYLRVVFVDHSESVGTASRLQADSFTFTDAENNQARQYEYADVARIEKNKTYVGEGSKRRHFPRLLLVGAAGAAAAGVAAGVMATH